MSRAVIFIEGGETEPQKTALRKAFHNLFARCGFSGKLPRTVACGSRQGAFDRFQIAIASDLTSLVALLVDSEDVVLDAEHPWEHLKNRPDDGWDPPAGASDNDVFLMTTSMETWLVVDHTNLQQTFDQHFATNSLPSLIGLESRDRDEVFGKLVHASRDCTKKYKKGEMSFEILERTDPSLLCQHLPSFARMIRILKQRL